MKLSSTQRFLHALRMEIAAEFFSRLNMSVERKNGCPTIIYCVLSSVPWTLADRKDVFRVVVQALLFTFC